MPRRALVRNVVRAWHGKRHGVPQGVGEARLRLDPPKGAGRPHLSARALPPCVPPPKPPRRRHPPHSVSGWAAVPDDALRAPSLRSGYVVGYCRPPTPFGRGASGRGQQGARQFCSLRSLQLSLPLLAPLPVALTRLRLVRCSVHPCLRPACRRFSDRLSFRCRFTRPTCVTALRIHALACGSLVHVVVSVPCAVGAPPPPEPARWGVPITRTKRLGGAVACQAVLCLRDFRRPPRSKPVWTTGTRPLQAALVGAAPGEGLPFVASTCADFACG
jgi:hypothetical protein